MFDRFGMSCFKGILVLVALVVLFAGCLPENEQAVVLAEDGGRAVDSGVPDWENPFMIGRNKEAAHSKFFPYAEIKSAD